jgi:hypothetical protein
MILITVFAIGGTNQPLHGRDSFGSDWHVDTFEGWDGPDVRHDMREISGIMGGSVGEWIYGPRPMTIKGWCWSPTESKMWQARQRLATITDCVTKDALLGVTEGNFGNFVCFIRRTGRLMMDTKTSQAFQFTIPIIAADPRKYSINTVTNNIAVPGHTNVTNVGTAPIDPIIHVNSGITFAYFTNVTDFNKSVAITGFGAGNTMEIRFKERMVLLNGVPRYDLLKPETRWWQLQPGVNDIGVSLDSGTATVTLTHTDAWI